MSRVKSLREVEIAVIGSGIAGIATAYYLQVEHDCRSVAIIDNRQPMSFTSAQSGDNYRNWWPHPRMVDFMNHSIDLMEQVARDSDNQLQMKRRGYALATRKVSVENIIDKLHKSYQHSQRDSIRVHDASAEYSYWPARTDDWQSAKSGVDVIVDSALLRSTFQAFDNRIANVIHVRRAGDINGQQMGQYMLERFAQAGGQRVLGDVCGIQHNTKYQIDLAGHSGMDTVHAEVVVNAAGPFTNSISTMLGETYPVKNVFQQKIAFDDHLGAVPRDLPFAIDLDEQELEWNESEKSAIAEDPELSWLAGTLPGGAHCRPDGAQSGQRVKLGWAYNQEESRPQEEFVNEPNFDPQFPEIVVRRLAALLPSLRPYIDAFPKRFSHYGGYYSMTKENWPLIGPTGADGAYIVGALSGFGSMAACAAGSICAKWINGSSLPSFATALSPTRYDDRELMAEIFALEDRGIL